MWSSEGHRARFSKHALQAIVQKRRSGRDAKQLANNEAIRVVPSPFCAFVFIKKLLYAKENKKYNQCEEGLLASSCLPIVCFQQNEVLHRE